MVTVAAASALGTSRALAAYVGPPPQVPGAALGDLLGGLGGQPDEGLPDDGSPEDGHPDDGPDARPSVAQAPAGEVAGDDQRTLLVLVTGEGAADDGQMAPPVSITLLAGAADGGQASLLHVPVRTLVQIPGFGLERVAAAATIGGPDLVEATVENAIGVDIDAHTVVTTELLDDFLGRADGLEVDLAARIVDRSGDDGARVVFPAGRQRLDGSGARTLWTVDADGDEFDRIARQQQVWDALLDRLAGDRTVHDRVLGDGAPQLRPAGAGGDDLAAQVIGDLVEARRDGDLAVELLPVSVLGADGADPTYRIDEDRLEAVVAGALAPSRPDGGTGGRVRVQILNGVGTPGIGRLVDRRLDGEAVRVVRSDNARDFDQDTTRILVYRETPAIRAAAERVRAKLGVGTIELSRQPQSIVDLTIVVGRDFDGADR